MKKNTPFTISIYRNNQEICKTKSRAKRKSKTDPESDPRWLELEFFYLLAKGDFNSIYGMCVQKLMQSDYEVDDLFVWHEIEPKYRQNLNKHLGRNFLYGIYTTAYARKNLLQAIIKNCPETFVYCDTDSVKFIGDTPFIDTNKALPEQYQSIPFLSRIGRFDKEHTYETFVTYGAKKYANTFSGDNKLYLTVAGLPKYNSDEGCIKRIEQFRPGIVFENCKLAKSTSTLTQHMKLTTITKPLTNKKSMKKRKDTY